MAGNDEILGYIADLSHADRAIRIQAAQRLNTAAFQQCFRGSNDWIRDPAFLELVSPPKKPSFVAGVAVHPTTFRVIRAANGSPLLADVPPDQDVMEFELHFGEGNNLDILTTRDPVGTGAIARYLARFGEGIQQIEVNVMNVDSATELLRTHFRLSPVYPVTRPGANGTRVNFFLAPIANGKKFLVELVEHASKD